MKARKLAKRLNGTRPAVTAAPKRAISMGPTVERLSHDPDIETAADGPLRGRVRVKPVLEVLRDRRTITREMYLAGEKYELHWSAGGLSERYASLRMDGTSGGGQEHASDAMLRHRAAYTEAVRDLGITLSRVVEEVCCRNKSVRDVAMDRWKDREQAQAAGVALLCAGLERLVVLWGLR
jgi:hypothetical protein